ncbi:molybdopterin-containing oxidoreductase family protein [Enhygromyxa salina]|uniref:Nitrate reductase n=1 Tax=Enhygromyxa salina TaxID=215803 RepID=A0A2S9YN35_9BACT|nr:molybdopterin-dependent oxidoreductase [Enhygromyxa salina]PRQ06490.1 Nitrate reductase [Enhygromyxa salina]
MAERVQTFCRICEALCGLEVETEGGRVTAIRPDELHPISRGYACVKGTRYAGIHAAADRINYPMRRTPTGWRRISWDRALREIGARIGGDLRRRGPRSVAMYLGNPTFFNYKAMLFAQDFMAALGSPNLFASHSIDCNNKLFVAEHMYGLGMINPVPDLDHTQLLVCLGSNPAISQMSFVRAPNALARLRGVVERGGRVVTIDPRRTETAARVGEHLFIRPGTDAWLLLALAHVLFAEGLADEALLRRHGHGLESLRAALVTWTPARAAALTGVPAASIVALARDLAKADGAAVYMSTGVNMGPFGSLAYWITQVLNFATGNLDRRGGSLVPRGALDLLAFAGRRGRRPARSRDGRWRSVFDALPAGALSEEIDERRDGIRNLIVCAGDPAHSIPGGQLRPALERLDTLVCIDLFVSETASRAHYLLPATDMLERSDFPLGTMLSQIGAHVQFTEAVVPPAFERREEWQIFGDLLPACGVRPPLGNLCGSVPQINRWLGKVSRRRADPDHLLAVALAAFGATSLRQLRANPRGLALPEVEPGSFLGSRVATKDGRVDLAPAPLLADLDRLAAAEPALRERIAVEGQVEDGELALLLIGRRERRSHNSWMLNNSQLQHPPSNVALLHPGDAASLGLCEGQRAELRSESGTARLPVSLSEDVRRGVVVVPHGWGHSRSAPGQAVAAAPVGANSNTLIPGGSSHLEPVSGQAIMTAIPIRVRRCEAAEELVS